MRVLKTWLTVGIVLCVGAVGCIAYYGQQMERLRSGTTPIAQALNAYVEQRAKNDEFAGTVLMVKNGKPVLEQGYGFANRAKNIPDASSTVYCIGSVGKLFTAVAIGQLAEEGKISFDAPIGTYISGFPSNIANNVTVAELLDMTGGFGNMAPIGADYPATLADLMKPIYTESLTAKPGVTFSYSNDGYIVLGAIVQKVSGEPYAAYVQEHIFAPAGMHDTAITAYKPVDVANMAHGYADKNGSLADISNGYEVANPSGGAYSTAEDLIKFGQALVAHKLLTAATTNVVLTPRVTTSQPGSSGVNAYTYGFGYQKENGVVFVGHNGGTPGYEDQLDIYPTKGYIVAVLTNQDNSMLPVITKSEALLTQ